MRRHPLSDSGDKHDGHSYGREQNTGQIRKQLEKPED